MNTGGFGNPFMRAPTLNEKDEVIHPAIRKKAASDNVLVTRFVDLVRLYVWARRNGAVDAGHLLKIIVESGGGWLRCSEDGYEVLTP